MAFRQQKAPLLPFATAAQAAPRRLPSFKSTMIPAHPSRARSRSGFTLIELLIVVVIIGILASIAIPKFSNTRAKAFASAVKSDLRNLVTAQEAYYYANNEYATNLAMLNTVPSSGVLIDIVEATAGGFSASATHERANPLVCAIYVGTAAPIAPATKEGVAACE
jgi:type IV pilus assembly protein PilA